MFLEKSQQAKQCVLSDFRVFLGVFGSSAFRLGTPSQQLHRGNTGQPSYLNAIAHLNTYIYIYIHTYIYIYIYIYIYAHAPPPHDPPVPGFCKRWIMGGGQPRINIARLEFPQNSQTLSNCDPALPIGVFGKFDPCQCFRISGFSNLGEIRA